MADFEIAFAGEHEIVAWLDNEEGIISSRLRPTNGLPHRRLKTNVGAQIEFRCQVDAVDAPLDGALGGRLFTAWIAEYPAVPVPTPMHPAGQTSVWKFVPVHVGHYLIVIRRENGGSVAVHFDAETP